MTFLIIGSSILVGFVLGYFFAAPALIAVTAICIISAIWLLKDWKNQELGQLFTGSAVIVLIIGNVSTWVTYYLTTEQQWIGQFLHGYVIR